MKTFFSGRPSIHPFEQLMGILLLILLASFEMDIDKMDALSSVIREFEFTDIQEITMKRSLHLLKFKFLLIHVK